MGLWLGLGVIQLYQLLVSCLQLVVTGRKDGQQ